MKKLILVFCAAFCLTIVSMGQITVTQANLPQVGYLAIERSDTIFTGLTSGSAGANQTWNFASWLHHTTESNGFVVPSTLPGASNFPTANVGINNGAANSSFANSSASGFDFLGYYGDLTGTGSMIPLQFNPSLKMVTVPSTYNTAYNGTYTYVIKVAYPSPPIDSVRITASVAYTSLIDGWGTITTPSHANVASLRQNYREIKNSTTELHMGTSWVPNGSPTIDTTYEIRWWSNTIGVPVAEISKSKTGAITGVKWNHTYALGTVGVAENASVNKDVNVYPNPATNVININGVTESSSIIISDITGKIVNGSILTKTNNTIDISKFDNGIYIYQIIDNKSKVTFNGRFVVTK